MCTLCIKPRGVAVPSEEYLKNMFKNNPDGSGIAYAFGGKIKVIKGLMSEGEFLKACSLIPVDAVAIIHSRITTSGGTSKELTHPYRLCNDIKEMRKTRAVYTDGFVVGHNGIFSEFGKKELNNDTTQFIITYLNNLQDAVSAGGCDILSKKIKPVIEKLTGTSKLAILSSDGRVEMFGSGWICDGGSYFSNSNYKPYEPAIWKVGYSNYYSGGYYNYNDYLKKYNKTIHNKELKELVKNNPELEAEILDFKEQGYFESEILSWYKY